MAAAAGKEESVSLSSFLELNDFEVEEELSTLAMQAWGRRGLDWQMACRTKRGVEEVDF